MTENIKVGIKLSESELVHYCNERKESKDEKKNKPNCNTLKDLEMESSENLI